MNRLFSKFTLYELVVCAVMAAVGIGIKPVVVPLAHLVCGPLMIPSGALAGGLYMMWLIVGYGIAKKPGTALIISIIQALLVIFTGVIGSHGIMSLATYVLPGVAAELVMLLTRHRGCCPLCCSMGGIAANLTGTACVNIIFFQVPGVYLILIMSISALSGLAGGVIGWKLLELYSKTSQGRKTFGKKCLWVEDLDEEIGDLRREGPEEIEKPVEKDQRKRKKIIAISGVALMAVAGICLAITHQEEDVAEGQIAILLEGKKVTQIEIGELLEMEQHTEDVSLKSSSKKDAEGRFTGVLLKTLLEEAKLEDKISGYSTVLLTAGDGYSSACDLEKADEVLVSIYLDGKPLGKIEDGGTGPLRAIFYKDTYGNRSVMNLVKIDIR